LDLLENPIGKFFQAARSWIGLRLDDVADAVGISRSAYQNIEAGRSRPRPDTEKRLIDFFRGKGLTFHTVGAEAGVAYAIAVNLPDGDRLASLTADQHSVVGAMQEFAHGNPVHMSTSQLLAIDAALAPAVDASDEIDSIKIQRKRLLEIRDSLDGVSLDAVSILRRLRRMLRVSMSGRSEDRYEFARKLADGVFNSYNEDQLWRGAPPLDEAAKAEILRRVLDDPDGTEQ
jgi:transcriptional regulator with XRE-family HTH domain